MSIIYTRDTGKGGQHKNKTDSCVVMTHYATGIKVKVDGRDQHKNKREAFREMTRRVNNFYRDGHNSSNAQERQSQIGTGLRSDKKRTYRVQDGTIIDHQTGKSCSFKKFMRGNLELLF